MRKLHVAAALATLAFFLAPPNVSAQGGLAEAAAREKERRKGVKGAKSFTEDDLRRAGAGVATTTETELPATEEGGSKEGAATKAEKKEEKSEDELKAERSAAWRKKVEATQQNVRMYEDQVSKIQLDLNDTSSGFYSARRNTLVSLLEETKKKLAEAQQALSDLEDEGRRNGFR